MVKDTKSENLDNDSGQDAHKSLTLLKLPQYPLQMKRLLLLPVLGLSILLNAQNTNISGTVNSYESVSNISGNTITVGSTAGFSQGDVALIIQMKGATMDETNSSAFGDVVNYNNAGNYELVTVCDVPNGTELSVSNIQRTYDPAQIVQIVRVPVYENATVTSVLTGDAWNGTTGGVIAIKCNRSLTLNADIDASGIGFIGAPLLTSSYTCQWFDIISDYYVTNASGQGALKGEGVADFITDKTAGKGAQTNGGGGGNDHNSGGAGGGNGGAGGQGGERIPQSAFYCSGQHPGVGGKAQSYNNTENKIFVGGGGGAGHENNTATGTPGMNGGGIIIIMTDTIYGNSNSILSNGLDAAQSQDGAGGGGAGGTVLIDANTYTGPLSVDISGGNGGDVGNGGPSNCNGPGGGGGGGVLWVSQANLPGNITLTDNGGISGVTVTASQANCVVGSANSATAGNTGLTVTDLSIPSPVPAATGTDVVTTCISHTWIDGYTYYADTVGATYTYIGGAVSGCDSTVTLDLTIDQVDVTVSQNNENLMANQSGATYQWIDCSSMIPISGETGQSYTATTNGNYAVVITFNGCADTSTCITVNNIGAGLTEFSTQIIIHPNPSNGEFTINLGSEHQKISFELLDLSGRIQREWLFEKASEIQLNTEVSSGTYLLVIRSDHQVGIKRLIVE